MLPSRWRVYVLGLLPLLLLALLTLLFRPEYVLINGARHIVPYGTTAARAAALAHLSTNPGDLVDVTGAVLKPGAGLAPIYLLRGRWVEANTRLRRDDALQVIPGRNRLEPVDERAILLPPEGGRAAVVGIRWSQHGIISGKANLEISHALPTASAVGKTRRLALTFDDGPWPGSTAQILSILNKHGARATFFVLGNQARKFPDLIRRELDQDCEIGLHTWNHANMAHLGAAAIRADLDRCEKYLQGLIPEPVRLMRPPYGALNPTARSAIAKAGYRVVLWSLDTNDWRRPGANIIYSRIINGAHDKAVVLCHDGGGPRAGTVDAISRAVPTLQAHGYELVTVSELLGLTGSGGIIVTASGERFRVEASVPGLRVLIDEKPIALPVTPVEINHQLLLPLKPMADLLGLKYDYDIKTQTVVLRGLGGPVTARFNSLTVTREDGSKSRWAVPPIIYQDHALLPLWPLLEAAGATARYEAKTKTLSILTATGLIQRTRLGRTAPPPFEHVDWKQHLAYLR